MVAMVVERMDEMRAKDEAWRPTMSLLFGSSGGDADPNLDFLAATAMTCPAR